MVNRKEAQVLKPSGYSLNGLIWQVLEHIIRHILKCECLGINKVANQFHFMYFHIKKEDIVKYI